MQASFQRTYDNGIATDHTHQLASVVRGGMEKGKVFTASYTVMSKEGRVNMNRLTHTKGMAEISGLLDDFCEARKLTNAPPIQTWSSDAVHIDGPTWTRKFGNDLNKGVVPYKGPSRDLPTLGIDASKYMYLSSIEQINRVALAIMDQYPTTEDIVYGLDAEWNWGETGMRLLIICMPRREDTEEINKVKLFDLSAADAQSKETFPKHLKTLLETRNYILTGCNVAGDLTRLYQYGVRVTRYYDVTGMAKQINPNLPSYKMEHLTEYFMKTAMDKSGQRGDYSENPLPTELRQYGAIDGAVSLQLFKILRQQLSIPQVEQVLTSPPGLSCGDIADLFLGGEKVARVRIHMTANDDANLTSKWGRTVVKRGKAVVDLLDVYFLNAHPPLSYRKNKNDEDDDNWDKQDVTLGELHDRKKSILVHTSSILIPLLEVHECFKR